MLSAARESIAVSSGSDSGNATLPDGGRAAESSSPEPSSSPDAAIDIPPSAGAPNEMLGPALSEDPAHSSGNPRRCDVLEEWEARGDVLDGEAVLFTNYTYLVLSVVPLYKLHVGLILYICMQKKKVCQRDI